MKQDVEEFNRWFLKVSALKTQLEKLGCTVTLSIGVPLKQFRVPNGNDRGKQEPLKSLHKNKNRKTKNK
jgi:hypothetical protein